MSFTNVKMRTPDGAEYGPVAWEELRQWQQQGRMPPGSIIIDADTGEERQPTSFPELSIPRPPMIVPPPPMQQLYYNSQPQQPNHIIPTRNPNALWAYYLGIFSFCCCGPILGIPAIILGIKGLKTAENIGEGKTHSIIGIVIGSITSLVFTVVLILILANSHF